MNTRRSSSVLPNKSARHWTFSELSPEALDALHAIDDINVIGALADPSESTESFRCFLRSG